MIDLIQRLPEIRGDYAANASMAKHTWFGVGGNAEVMFSPKDSADLAHFMANLDPDIPLYPIGAGSNLLVRDGGIGGVVINMTTHMNSITRVDDDGEHDKGERLIVGAGLHDADVARAAAKMGLAGLEFLIGIPGTIGGGLRMNAGAYGTEFKDIVITAEAIDRQGQIHTVTPEDMGMRYRHSDAPLDWVFTHAVLQARHGKPEEIRARMKEIVGNRADAQPRGVRTGGSTFANPDGHKAWQLIDQAGFRGHQLGQAMVSDKHCNFLINTGGATAHEIETLGETVRAAVKDHAGVDLRWEIRRIGQASASPETGGRDD